MGETLSAIVSSGAKTRTQAALYLGLNADAPLTDGARLSLEGIDRVDLGRGQVRSIERRNADGARLLVIRLADARMSEQHARITRLGTRWFVEDLGSKNGTWIGNERITRHELTDGAALCVGHTMLVFREAGGEAGDLESLAATALGLATWSAPLAARFGELATAARTNVPIEVTGASGTGKELVAQAVHSISGRRGKLAAINCGALPPNLLEGELFGHKKGAFTGAGDDRLGLVRTADAGTLFLDEIAELAPTSQAALLRVLQEGEVIPLGTDSPVKVDIRLVTATHKSLDHEVDANRFRADLRARMLGVQITLPALHERREDLGLLVATLLRRLAPGRAITFSADAAAALYAYDWPLNIRELERTLAAALAVAADRIELHHLPAAVRGEATRPPATNTDDLSEEDRAIRDSLTAALARHDGNLAAVARDLGKDRTQIRRWMKRFGLSRDV